MFRKLIVSLFIFTSLSAQASTAFTCKMMNQVVMTHCCCHHGDTQQPMGDQPCCEEVTLINDDGGASVSAKAAKLPLPDLQPQPILLAADIILPATSLAQGWATPPPHITQRSGSLTYLRTQRLRI